VAELNFRKGLEPLIAQRSRKASAKLPYEDPSWPKFAYAAIEVARGWLGTRAEQNSKKYGVVKISVR
jgi:hypothetical protein